MTLYHILSSNPAEPLTEAMHHTHHGGVQVAFPRTSVLALLSLYSRYGPKSFWFHLLSLSSFPTCFRPAQLPWEVILVSSFKAWGWVWTKDSSRTLKDKQEREVKLFFSASSLFQCYLSGSGLVPASRSSSSTLGPSGLWKP